MNLKGLKMKSSIFLCCLIVINAELKEIKKRGLMEEFLNMPRPMLRYSEDLSPDLIGTFLPPNHQIEIQHLPNTNFLLHFPGIDPNCVKFSRHQINPQFLPVSIPSNIPLQVITPNIPNVPVPPINVPNIPVTPPKIPDSSNPAADPTKQPMIFPNEENDPSLDSPLDIRNEKKKTDYTVFPETVSDANVNHIGISNEIKPAAELSEINFDAQNPVIPLIPVSSETTASEESSSKFEETHTFENKTENWIEIPKYYYKPVQSTANNIENNIIKTTFPLQEDKRLIRPSEQNRPSLDISSGDIHFTVNNQAVDLPAPSFNNLEDLLNRTSENTTTVVFTRMKDTTNNETKNKFVANGLSYKPEGEGKEINYLTKYDPKNPPAPINQQPNTLLIGDWLKMGSRMYDKLGPEDQKKVFEAYKAVFTGNKIDKIDDNDDSDVQLKLRKNLYLVAERTKKNEIDLSVRINDNKIKPSEKQKVELHDKEIKLPTKEKIINIALNNNTNATTPASTETPLKKDRKQPTALSADNASVPKIFNDPKIANNKHARELDNTYTNNITENNFTDSNKPPLSYLMTIFDQNFDNETESTASIPQDKIEAHNNAIPIFSPHDTHKNDDSYTYKKKPYLSKPVSSTPKDEIEAFNKNIPLFASHDTHSNKEDNTFTDTQEPYLSKPTTSITKDKIEFPNSDVPLSASHSIHSNEKVDTFVDPKRPYIFKLTTSLPKEELDSHVKIDPVGLYSNEKSDTSIISNKPYLSKPTNTIPKDKIKTTKIDIPSFVPSTNTKTPYLSKPVSHIPIEEIDTPNNEIQIPAPHVINSNREEHTTTDPSKPPLSYLLTIFDQNFDNETESASDDHSEASAVSRPHKVNSNEDKIKSNNAKPHPPVPPFNINNIPHINNNLRPALESLANTLWSSSAHHNHNTPVRDPSTNNVVPKSSLTVNTSQRPSFSIPAPVPTPPQTGTELLTNMLSRIVRGVVHSTVREVVRNYGDGHALKFLQRLFG